MHQPRPYGLHAIGKPLTEKDETFIASIAKRITNLKDISGVDSLKMVYDLPDGGYVIVQDMGGNFRVIAHKPVAIKNDVVATGIANTGVPMLYSGVITKSVVRKLDEGVGLRITQTCRRRLTHYNPENPMPSKDLQLQRFKVDYDDSFMEFKETKESLFLKTQYDKLRPTWYSGAMSEVMQVVGGYGKSEALIDDIATDATPAYMTIPNHISKNIEQEVKGVRLLGFTGEPMPTGQFVYDYKFNKTNAVGFDSDKKPWLLQIEPTGVWAMPLPIIPATATKAFRRYIEGVGDDEIVAILNRFGALPSGEPMPTGSAKQAWIRAGVIIKVCGVSDFYDHIAYSSSCGWAINSSGSEGYNTCYDYHDDEGIGYGLTYKLKLDLKPARNYTGVESVELDMNDYRTPFISAYLSTLLPMLAVGNNENRAILLKLRLVDIEDIYARAISGNGDSDYNYWRELVLPPIAEHKGNVSEVYRGYLYHGAKFKFQPQIKFPEPLLNGCVSHDFMPLDHGRGKAKYPNSDTIMYAYYIGNSLKVIKYFIDWDSFKAETVSNFESQMYAGSWSKVESSGLSAIQGCFYSSDIDDRETINPVEITTNIIGTDRGFDTKPWFEFNAYGSMMGVLTRRRYFSHKTKKVRTEGVDLNLAVCLPFFCRSVAIHAERKRVTKIVNSESQELFWNIDPTEYIFWTYHPVFAWFGMTLRNPKGDPYPKDGNPVWVEEKRYNDSRAYNYADNGDWLPALPQDYTWLIHPNSNKWSHSGGGSIPHVDTYSITDPQLSSLKYKLKVSHGDQPALLPNQPNEDYFMSSPDPNEPDKLPFYRSAAAVVFGETDYRSVSEPSATGAMTYWGYSKLVDHKSPHHFIGVINE